MSGSEDETAEGDLQFSFEEELIPEKKGEPQVIPKQSDRKIFIDFLKNHTCYETIPPSGKIVVLDCKLSVKSAILALLENQIKSAPLWGSEKGDYIGMITVTDFIQIILKYYYHSPSEDKNIISHDEFQICKWRDSISQSNEMIFCSPNDSLYEAAQILLNEHIHRLPIIDKENDNSILHFISHHRIFVFMINNLKGTPELLSKTIKELGIGTFNNVVTVFKETPLGVVLNLLIERHISSVPVVDETGVVQYVYSKSDAVLLVSHVNLMNELGKPIQEFVDINQEVYRCKRDDTLKKVLTETMHNGLVRQVVCVDNTNRIVGIISLSDIMKYILNDIIF